ncbi:MAG: HNH endonuclease [Planctomycetaceae bacterium]|nr:HNH endonuclease [Planctomycetaceae bacterium]
MDDVTREHVRQRAGYRCEYCRLRQEHYSLWRHQIEHIIPRKHHGDDDVGNLALACIRCNLGKSSNLSGIDSDTGEIVALFHPRNQQWDDHFAYDGHVIVGRTPTGRVTADVLNMNEPERLRLRRHLLENGELT